MKNLLAKLLAVQQNVRAITKDSVNPHFRNKYYDINTLISELKPVLNEHKLVVLQPLITENGVAMIETMVADPESGENMSWRFPLPETQSAQQMGAAVSYMRRYALSSLFLLEGEDDDGNSAPVVAKAAPKATAFAAAKQSLANAKTEDAKKSVMALISASEKLTDEQKRELLG